MNRFPLIALVCAIFSTGADANTQLWLSDQPPDKNLLQKMQHSHGGYVYVENDVYIKQLWLRKGDSLFKSSYAESVADNFEVLDTQQKISKPVVEHGANSHSIRFQMPDEGFYNAYYTERSVADNVLNVTMAKAEVLKHSCRLGHNYDRKLVNPNQWADAPMEIVRLLLPEEDFHTNIQSGALLKFKVFYKGRPVSSAQVKLETQKGWVNTKTTDRDGIAAFQIIQDNFPAESKPETRGAGAEANAADLSSKKSSPERSHALKSTALGAEGTDHKPSEPAAEKSAEHAEHGSGKKGGGGGHEMRQKDNFLVHAEYTVDENGELNGAPYRQAVYSVTMTGSYMPNVQVDQSRSQALMYASAGFLVLGGSAVLYRRRRVKPFKEVGFDEH
ncbi:MAG: hypothetical protein ACXWF8_18695 [Methylobacter sp.]